jgi:thymidine kinase
LKALADRVEDSRLAASLAARHRDCADQGAAQGARPCPEMLHSLRLPCLAERALVYLYAEQNLLSAEQLRRAALDLRLDRDYLMRRLADNRRPLDL